MSADYKCILLIKPSALGDVVLALPALSSLRRNWPQAQIAWLVRPEFAPLLEGHPHLDEIIHFDRTRLANAWRELSAFRELRGLVAELRRRRFDAVLDLQGLFRTASLAWLSGCDTRFGPRWDREFAHWFYTTTFRPQAQWVHVIDYYMKLIEAMGGSDLQVEFLLPEKSEARMAAGRLLSEQGVDAERYAVLIPGAAHASKCWPVERFAAMADRLASEHGLSVVATGGAAERPIVEQIAELANAPVASLAGRTALPELVEVLRGATLVVSNDTGPAHIAAALGRPLVMLFSWANPLRLHPYGRPGCVVARDMSSRGLAIKSRDPAHAIEHLTFDEVYAKAVEQLSPAQNHPA